WFMARRAKSMPAKAMLRNYSNRLACAYRRNGGGAIPGTKKPTARLPLAARVQRGRDWPVSRRAIMKNGARLACGLAGGFLTLLLMAFSTKVAAAQSADAQERCTGDVMRLCSEFVPDADSIVT